MEFRPAPLPDHQQYFLDCAVECYELDACTHAILRLYGDADELGTVLEPPAPSIELTPADIQRMIDGPHDVRTLRAQNNETLRGRRARCEALSDIADTTLRRLDPAEAGGLAYHGLVEIPHRVDDLAAILAQWAVIDETVGGQLKDFKRGRRRRLDRNDDPPPRLARKLASPRFIRNFIRHADESTPHLRSVVQRSVARARAADPACLRSRYGDIVRAMARQREVERQAEYARLGAKPAPPPLVEAKRKMVRRSLATAESVVGTEIVGAFIKGKEVELPGERITLVLARNGSLAAIGHSTVAVAVKDRAGERLGELCVYFEGTPTLDQLTAFALHMQAGLEQEIVDSANVISLSELGREHPMFAERAAKKQRLIERDSAALIGQRVTDLSTWERDRARSDRYWARTGTIWNERLTAYCLGRDTGWVTAAISAGRKQT